MEGFDIKKYRKYIALGLLAIIILMGFYVYNHKDELFMNRVVVEYPDGCKETFENAVLVTEMCVEGRDLEYKQSVGGGKWPTQEVMNFSFENITIR